MLKLIICLWSNDMDERDESEDFAAPTNSKMLSLS